MLLSHHRLSDSEIEANAPLVAAGILRHPASLLMRAATISALADLVARHPPSATAPECLLVSDAVGFVEAIEIAISREARP